MFSRTTSLTRFKSNPIPTLDIKDRIKWKFTSHGDFFVKTVTWPNNNNITHHPKAYFLNSIWQLNLIPKIGIFTWKLVGHTLLTRQSARIIGVNIDGDCPFC